MSPPPVPVPPLSLQEAAHVLGMQLILEAVAESIDTETSQIVVEVALNRREDPRLDPAAGCAGKQAVS